MQAYGVNLLDHDSVNSAIDSAQEGDVIVLLEGAHALNRSIDVKRIEIVGFAAQDRVFLVPPDATLPPEVSQRAVMNVADSSFVRVFNVAISGPTTGEMACIRVGKRPPPPPPRKKSKKKTTKKNKQKSKTKKQNKNKTKKPKKNNSERSFVRVCRRESFAHGALFCVPRISRFGGGSVCERFVAELHVF